MPSTCSMQMVRSFAPGGSNVLSSRVWGSEFRVLGLGCWGLQGPFEVFKWACRGPSSQRWALFGEKKLGGTFLGTCHGLLKRSLDEVSSGRMEKRMDTTVSSRV